MSSSENLIPHTSFTNLPESSYSSDEQVTDYKKITGYNNFYEFGLGKTIIAELAENFETRPWTLSIEGECLQPKIWDIDEIINLFPLEERIYRLRCVEEAWSMAEAMHPLTLLSVGLYGEVLPNQNGAPIRLVVPWKYGFKSIKSIVRIRFVKKQPWLTWHRANPEEYGFYANVNPDVDHPRWSQAKERRIGDFFKRPTLLFNGYADQVAHLYKYVDLQRRF